MPIQHATGSQIRQAKRDPSKGYPEEEGAVWSVDYEKGVIVVRMLRNHRMVRVVRYMTSAPRSAGYGKAELPRQGDRVVIGYLNGELAFPYIKGYLRTPGDEEPNNDLKPAKGEFRRKTQSGVIIEADADGNIEITLPRTRGEDEEEIRTAITINGREVKVVNGQTILNGGTQGLVSEAEFKKLINWLKGATQTHPYGPTTGWVEPPPEIKYTMDLLVNTDWEPEE